MTTKTETTREILIPSYRMDDLQATLARLERRAKKIRCEAPTVRVLGEELVEVVVGYDELYHKPKMAKVLHTRLEVSTAPVVVDGWTFAATLEHTPNGNVVHKAPGFHEVEVPVQFRDCAPRCDHCGTVRRRNDTFLVADESGRWKQVGRNCLKDFFGHDPVAAVARLEWSLKIEGYFGEFDADEYFAMGGAWLGYEIHEFLVVVCYAIRAYGWVSRKAAYESDGCRRATANVAESLLTPSNNTKVERERWAELQKISVSDREKADAALAWAEVTFADRSKLNDYQHNLAVAVAADFVTTRNAGIVASLIVAFDKDVERKAEVAARLNEHFGAIEEEKPITRGPRKGETKTVKPRYELSLEIERVIYHENEWGSVGIHTMRDEAGRSFVWFGSKDLTIDGDTSGRVLGRGDRFVATWSVKKHDERNGMKQTVLSRPSKVSLAEAGR